MPDSPFPEAIQESSNSELVNSSNETPSTPNDGGINHVIEGSGKPARRSSKTVIKIMLFIITITVISGLAGGFVILQNYRNDPLRLIAESFKNIESASSFTAHATFPKIENYGLVNLILDYHKTPYLFSRGQVRITDIDSEVGNNLQILAIFNSTDTYVSANYSKIDELEGQLNLLYPGMTSLDAFQILLPVIKGQKWVHIESSPEESSQNDVVVSDDKARQINQKFIDSIIVRSHDTNYKLGDKRYQKIVLGFDENKLVDFIESFKSLDLEIQLKEINSLIKVVQSADNWNDDLVEILIEKDTGNLYSLSLSLPKFPEDALQQTIDENLQNGSSVSSFSRLFSDKFKGMIKPQSSGELTYVGHIEFNNYSEAPSAQIPTPIVEQKEVESAIERDLPILLQVMFTASPQTNFDSNLYLPNNSANENHEVLSATESSLKK